MYKLIIKIWAIRIAIHDVNISNIEPVPVTIYVYKINKDILLHQYNVYN